MLKPLCFWSGKARKLKGFGGLSRICRCAFVVDGSEICFRLPRWGEKIECFGKTEHVKKEKVFIFGL